MNSDEPALRNNNLKQKDDINNFQPQILVSEAEDINSEEKNSRNNSNLIISDRSQNS